MWLCVVCGSRIFILFEVCLILFSNIFSRFARPHYYYALLLILSFAYLVFLKYGYVSTDPDDFSSARQYDPYMVFPRNRTNFRSVSTVVTKQDDFFMLFSGFTK